MERRKPEWREVFFGPDRRGAWIDRRKEKKGHNGRVVTYTKENSRSDVDGKTAGRIRNKVGRELLM